MRRYKLERGLGFKDFEAFILALLVKLGWRIIQYPDQIWVKLLKARYFPNCLFFDIVKGRTSLWLWSSILEARRVLEDQVIIIIGNGINSRVWQDLWLGNLLWGKLISPCPHEAFKDLRVADLMSEGWNLLSIEDWILEVEKEAILSTIVNFKINRDDKWVWIGGNRNEYSVMEGYEIAKRNVLRKLENVPGSSNNA